MQCRLWSIKHTYETPSQTPSYRNTTCHVINDCQQVVAPELTALLDSKAWVVIALYTKVITALLMWVRYWGAWTAAGRRGRAPPCLIMYYSPKWAAAANFVDSLCPFPRSFGCVLVLNQIFWKQCTVRQYTTPIYLINLLWKLWLGLRLDSAGLLSIFSKSIANIRYLCRL